MIVNDIPLYDGSLIHQRFAYKYFKNKTYPTGNIIAFRAPMEVLLDGMIDQEDLLNEDFIYSDDAINFCWEIPLSDAWGGVAFQRLFCSAIGNLLGSASLLNCPVLMDGDDIIVQKEHQGGGIVQPHGKASVSISHFKCNCNIGHLGINVEAGKKAPAFAFSTKLNNEQINYFMSEGIKIFYQMTHSLFIATTKTI